jgi:nitrite reductase/ring-hydroxylating ferredoxin subunit
MSNDTKKLVWYKALDKDELPKGRVKPVTLGHLTVAMTHYKGRYGALNNKCPHQGGPLGEGSIDNGLLRCPPGMDGIFVH